MPKEKLNITIGQVPMKNVETEWNKYTKENIVENGLGQRISLSYHLAISNDFGFNSYTIVAEVKEDGTLIDDDPFNVTVTAGDSFEEQYRGTVMYNKAVIVGDRRKGLIYSPPASATNKKTTHTVAPVLLLLLLVILVALLFIKLNA